METFSQEREDSLILSCRICLQPKKDRSPKGLQCQHSFCKECLVRWHKNAIEECDGSKYSIRCPHCHQETKLENGTIDDLPVDFKVEEAEDLLQSLEDKLTIYDKDEEFQIFANTIGGKTVTLFVRLSETVESLKKKIEMKDGTKPDHQRILCGRKQMMNGHRLEEYDIRKNCNIQVVGRLLGGRQISFA